MLLVQLLPNWRNASVVRLSLFMLLITTHLGQASYPLMNVQGSFKNVHQKPSQGDLIESIAGKDRVDQCMKECLFAVDCLITVFDRDQKTCDQFDSFALEEALGTSQTAVRKESWWSTIDGLRDLTTEISYLSVSTEQATRMREMAIDGIITVDNGWGAHSLLAPKWFQMNFAEEKIVYRVDILSRCGMERQSTGYRMSYNGGFRKVTRVCTMALSSDDCTDTRWETYPLGLGGVGTTYVNVSASTFCDASNEFYGIREITIYGL